LIVNSKHCPIVEFQLVVNVDLELPYNHIDIYIDIYYMSANTNKVTGTSHSLPHCIIAPC